MSTETPEHYCPRCGRRLAWYPSRPGCGHGEALHTMADGSLACGDCAGRPRTVAETLRATADEREAQP